MIKHTTQFSNMYMYVQTLHMTREGKGEGVTYLHVHSGTAVLTRVVKSASLLNWGGNDSVHSNKQNDDVYW